MSEPNYVTQGHLVAALLENTDEALRLTEQLGRTFHINASAQKEQQPYLKQNEISQAEDEMAFLIQFLEEYTAKFKEASTAADVLLAYREEHLPARGVPSRDILVKQLTDKEKYYLERSLYDLRKIKPQHYLAKKGLFRITYEYPDPIVMPAMFRGPYKSKFHATAEIMILFERLTMIKVQLQAFMEMEADLELAIAGAVPKNALDAANEH